MHQQIRTGLGKSGLQDGTGAMASIAEEIDPLEIRRGALLELLELLDQQGYDLGMAAGDAIELGGEFTFALKDHGRTGDCATMLRDSGFRNVRLVRVQLLMIPDEKGSLKRAIGELTDKGLKIDEIYVGVKGDDGLVPVQVTTIRDLDGQQSA